MRVLQEDFMPGGGTLAFLRHARSQERMLRVLVVALGRKHLFGRLRWRLLHIYDGSPASSNGKRWFRRLKLRLVYLGPVV